MRGLRLAMVLVVAAVCLYDGIMLVRESSARQRWPTTPGRLLERQVEAVNPGSRSTLYRSAPRYRFTVDGQEFTGGEQFSRGGQVGTRAAMQRLVEALPDEPDVHYDPRDPSRSFLVLTPSPWGMLTLSIGIAALALGIGMLVSRLLWG
jgi:hypothetical protein